MGLTNKLSAIGDAIRSKTGSSELLTLDQMPQAIESITTGSKELVLTKLGEYTIQEPVSIFNITPTEEMKKCNFLYVNLINVKPATDDWIYTRINKTALGYTSTRVSVLNGFFVFSKIPSYNNYNEIGVTIKGSFALSNWDRSIEGKLDTFGINVYESANTLESGNIEVWGYV